MPTSCFHYQCFSSSIRFTLGWSPLSIHFLTRWFTQSQSVNVERWRQRHCRSTATVAAMWRWRARDCVYPSTHLLSRNWISKKRISDGEMCRLSRMNDGSFTRSLCSFPRNNLQDIASFFEFVSLPYCHPYEHQLDMKFSQCFYFSFFFPILSKCLTRHDDGSFFCCCCCSWVCVVNLWISALAVVQPRERKEQKRDGCCWWSARHQNLSLRTSDNERRWWDGGLVEMINDTSTRGEKNWVETECVSETSSRTRAWRVSDKFEFCHCPEKKYGMKDHRERLDLYHENIIFKFSVWVLAESRKKLARRRTHHTQQNSHYTLHLSCRDSSLISLTLILSAIYQKRLLTQDFQNISAEERREAKTRMRSEMYGRTK